MRALFAGGARRTGSTQSPGPAPIVQFSSSGVRGAGSASGLCACRRCAGLAERSSIEQPGWATYQFDVPALADVWLCPLGGTDHWQEDALHAVVPAALACLNIGVGRKAEAQCYSVYLPSSAARPCWRAMSLRERQPKRTMREASAMADLDAITTLQACSVANSCSLPPLRIRHGKARRRRGTRANRP